MDNNDTNIDSNPQPDIQYPDNAPDISTVEQSEVENTNQSSEDLEEIFEPPKANDRVTIKYSIPTANVILDGKGKDIPPIILPQQTTTSLLKDPYWRTIIGINKEYGGFWLDPNVNEEFTKIKNKIKGDFEIKFGRLFTDAEYKLAEYITEAVEVEYSFNILGEINEEVQDREGSIWEQEYRDTRDVTYPIGAAGKSKDRDFSSSPIDGTIASTMLAERMGFGTYGTFRLPNSGFVVRFSNPSNSEFFALEDSLSDEKINLGMNTLGYFFGANAQRINGGIANFILSKIVSTIPHVEREELKKYIKVTDLHALAIGISNVMYPDGYPFSTPCTKCGTLIDHGLVKPARLMWVNNPAIPQGCKKIFEKKVVQLIDIQEYQAEIERNIPNNFYVIGRDSVPTIIKFRIPTLLEVEQQSELWMNKIEALMSLDRTDLTEGQRKSRYERHASALMASEYLGYVDYIYMMDVNEMDSDDYVAGRYENLVNSGNPNRKLSDREGILNLLNVISQDDATTLDFLQAIALYRESSHLYIVGVPEMLCDCVKSKMTVEEIDHHRKHPKLTPLDAIALFFTLRGRRSTVSRVPIKQVQN